MNCWHCDTELIWGGDRDVKDNEDYDMLAILVVQNAMLMLKFITIVEKKMKIRFYKKIDGWRWTGFIVAMIGTFILSSANVETQWIGWSLGLISCSIWVYFGWKDGDTPRALMELMYLLLSIRAVYNWLVT